jgi:hypothetical protein
MMTDQTSKCAAFARCRQDIEGEEMKIQDKEETKEQKGSRELELDKQHHKTHTDHVTLAIGSCAILHDQLNESDHQPLRLNGMNMPAYSVDLLNHAV